MADVEFIDNRVKVKNTIDKTIKATLEECSAEIESQAKRNSRSGTGQTKNSWKHIVIGLTATIGNTSKNSIWEEFGTGEHAITENGGKGGRKTPWYVPVQGYTGKKKPTYNGKVVVVYGKNGKMFYKTNGKKPSRAFFKAYTSLKSKIIKRLQNCLKGL